jgi:hypothetical protein
VTARETGGSTPPLRRQGAPYGSEAELWEVEHFADEAEARVALERFFVRYNHERLE